MTRLDEWLAGGRRRPLGPGGQTIFFRQDGPPDGLPVTLLHGFPTSSHDWALILGDLVGVGMRITSLDFLGFGASDKPHPHRYAITEQTDLVQALWQELGIDRTALVAHDFGVSVAQELIAREPHRVTRATFLNGGVYPDLHRPVGTQRLLHGRLGPLAVRAMGRQRFGQSLNQVLARPFTAEQLDDMWRGVTARDGRRVIPSLLRYIDDRRENGERWTSALEGFSGPLQFVWGPVDPVSGAHVVPRLRDRLPRADIHVLTDPDIGHYPQIEDPERVGPLIAKFLAR